MQYSAGLTDTLSVARREAVLAIPYTNENYPKQPGVVKVASGFLATLAPQYAVMAKLTATGALVPYVAGGVDGSEIPVGLMATDAGTLLASVDAGGIIDQDQSFSYYVGGKFYLNDPSAVVQITGYDANVLVATDWTLDGNVLYVK